MTHNVVFSDQELPTSVDQMIFLAGPTPRDKRVSSWRPEAVRILRDLGYQGHIFVPEPSSSEHFPDYIDQVDWEQAAIRRSDCVLFWIPRDLDTMPGFTTNVEFGDCLKYGNLVMGAPPDTPKMRYLIHRGDEVLVPQATTLDETCLLAMSVAAHPGHREDGEVTVPGYIWSCPAFQSWYSNVLKAGNELRHAEVQWVFRIPSNLEVFSFALKAHVYITTEDRVKTNEFVLARSDIGAACLWHRNPMRTKVVLVREFRTSGNTPNGYVLELPSGSSLKEQDMYEVAITELQEETTVVIPRERFKMHPPRQLAGTLSSHRGWLVSVELTAEELEHFEKLQGHLVQGEEETEKTYVEVRTLKELLKPGPDDYVDYTTLGMIYSALLA